MRHDDAALLSSRLRFLKMNGDIFLRRRKIGSRRENANIIGDMAPMPSLRLASAPQH